MVRQYKIHTNLDGSDNEIIDLTDGKIRLYQPSDLGIVTNTNIWSSQGLGVFGDTAISHPSMDFRLETFGDSLEENYNLMNNFVSKILAQKYVTIEYTSEMGTFYADVKLAKVSKTEGYGQNGTFSETISFDVINKWYTYEALTFSKFKNAEFSEQTKIHAPLLKNQENYNLLTGTKDFSGAFNTNWNDGGASFYDDGYYNGFKVKSTKNQWCGLYQEYTVTEPGTYTFSSFVKSDYEDNEIHRFVIISGVIVYDEVVGHKFNWMRDSVTIPDLSVGDVIHIRYEKGTYNNNPFSVAGYKLEYSSTATLWMPSESEAKEMGRYTYTNNAYVYTTEDNIDRFSKWKIKENVFSFVARFTPSDSNEKKYGVRFLDEQANEYTSIIFNLTNKPDYIQLNTDTNDEYYQTVTAGIAVNMFSALDFQKFRTRIFRKGTMELVNLDTVEINVKRKVDFV